MALFGANGVNCIQCHTMPATLRRDAVDVTMLADRISTAISSNTGRMGDTQYGYATLTRAQLLDLAAYLVSLAPQTQPPHPDAGPSPASSAVQCLSTGSSTFRTEVFTSGLSSPWGMAFLPDRRVLVTQKGGTMVLVSSTGMSRTTLSWSTPAPNITSAGQGGLLDVALDPDFATTPWVYFAYSEPAPNNLAGVAVGRAQLQGSSLTNFSVIYRQTPKVDFSDIHFGARLAFRSDRTLFVSMGDRGYDQPSSPGVNYAQDLRKSIGKIIRINRDGTVPGNNPWARADGGMLDAGVLPEIWSSGHRNPQGLSFDTMSATLWSAEHGPQGGDEINRVVASANYGWPLRSYGCPYGAPQGTACRVGGGVHATDAGPSFVEPLAFWAPTSMAPSNLIMYRGAGFPAWNGQLFLGSLAGSAVWRISLNPNGTYASCERLSIGTRVRDVREGPDGWIWLLTDSGEVRRLLQ
jgi:aldose sugar dehydrogenase